MEVERESLRARQLRARDLLRGDLEGRDLDQYVEERLLTTTLENVLNWGRSNALFPMTFGLACCAIEMMSMVTSRYDIARFGAEAFRASPRQADMLILSGRVSVKMAPVVRRVYDQMLEPKWVIAMGACSSSGGMFANYAVVQGADKFMPVDIHVPGCPPRPEALLHGFNKLQRLVRGQPDLGWRERYNAIGHRGVGPLRVRRADAGGARARRHGGRGARRMPDAPGLELIAQGIEEGRQGTVIETSFEHGRATLIVNPDGVLHALSWLRDTPEQGYRFLSSLHAADYLPATPRFAVHYELLCRERMERLHVKAAGLTQESSVASRRRPRMSGSEAEDMPVDEAVRPQIDSCVELFPPPSSRSGRPTTSSGSSSGAIPTCAGS